MSRVALVTGANQGLGLALVEGLAQELQADDFVYLTGRNGSRVAAAREQVGDVRASVRTRILDVRDPISIDQLASELAAVHGGLDILFSNHYARVMPTDSPAEVVSGFVDTNNLGTTRLLRAFAPILRSGGRLLVVASTYGSLIALPPQLHPRFTTNTMSLEDLDATMLAWRDEVIDGKARDEGWPEFINIPSKVGQVAAMRILARDRRALDLQNGTLVAAVCPGMIDTGASRPWFDMTDAQTPEQAAAALLRLAIDPDHDPAFYGELVRFGRVLPWR
jgi:NAD(P)-dependent dehydrogenase (short-subunit alcohol dehydrogenase family)